MFKKSMWLVILMISLSATTIFAQNKTVVNDAKAKTMLLGKHKLSLQWISWDYFGNATITNRRGIFYVKGSQQGRGKDSADYLKIDGVITAINAKEFSFAGKIEMRISHINSGEPCLRDGDFTFRVTGKRKYWRLQEMDNPCDAVTDYVDIYFR